MKSASGVLFVVVVVFSMILAGCGSASTPAPSASASPAPSASQPAPSASQPAPSASQPAEKAKVVSPEERRAQWIEGAKKEATLSWWGTTAPEETSPYIAEFNKKVPPH